MADYRSIAAYLGLQPLIHSQGHNLMGSQLEIPTHVDYKNAVENWNEPRDWRKGTAMHGSGFGMQDIFAGAVNDPDWRKNKHLEFMKVCGQDIKIQGKLIRIAGLSADTFEFLDDPEMALVGLRNTEERIDLFTFMQRLPDASPKYSYSMEWDNLAVLPVSTFDH